MLKKRIKRLRGQEERFEGYAIEGFDNEDDVCPARRRQVYS